MTDSKSKILVQNTKWVYIAKIIGQIIGLLSSILVIRKFSVGIYGTYNLLIQSFVVFEIFAISAIQQVFLRYVPELIANKDFIKFKQFVFKGFILTFFSFMFFFIILYMLRDSFASFFKIPDFESFLVPFFLYSLFASLRALASTTLHALLLHKKFAFITIFNASIKLTLYLIFYKHLTVSLLLYIEIITTIVFIASGVFIYFNYLSGINLTQNPSIENPVSAKRVFRYGLFSSGNAIGQGIVGRTSDYFIVAALSNPIQVGLYAFAVKIYGFIFKILPAKQFYSVLRPLFLQKYSQNYNVEEFQKMLAFMVKGLIPIYLFPFFYFFFFGKNVINIIFDPRYIDAYWVIVILLLTDLLNPFYATIGFILQLKERVDIEMYSKIIIFLSIALGIYGMKTFGIIGVAIATFFGLNLKNIIIWIYMTRYPEVKFKLKDYSGYFIIIICIIPFIIIHFSYLTAITLCIWSIIFIFYAIVIFFIFNPFNEYELLLLNKLISNILIFVWIKKNILRYIPKKRKSVLKS